jgi:hypothetical protein
LGPGGFRAEIYADDLETEARKLARHTAEVTAADVLTMRLESAGGHLVRLSPIVDKSPEPKKKK